VDIQPLTKWPEKNTEERKKAPFKATCTNTLQLLTFEIEKLSARKATLQTNLGVVLTFEKFDGWDEELKQSQYSELRMPCDTFSYWKDNVRAVALVLEALRKIDRYGVRTGSQYAGFKALPAADVEMTPELAADFIARSAGMGNVPGITSSIIQNTAGFGGMVYKAAAKVVHPDKGGATEEFKRIEKAQRANQGVASE
jgi:hypothetical protein